VRRQVVIVDVIIVAIIVIIIIIIVVRRAIALHRLQYKFCLSFESDHQINNTA
jgi:hypothetical protein